MEFVSIASLSAVAGFIANQLVEILKPLVPASMPAEARKATIQLLSLGVMFLVALGVGWASVALGYIQVSEVGAVILGTLPATGGWYQLDSRRQLQKAVVKGESGGQNRYSP